MGVMLLDLAEPGADLVATLLREVDRVRREIETDGKTPTNRDTPTNRVARNHNESNLDQH